jgi:zinc protease
LRRSVSNAVWGVILFLLLTSVALGAERLDVREHTLKNGLKVLVLEDHSAPLVAVQVWVNVGARNDPAGMSGMAHLVEHMMFKGTSSMGSEEFSEVIQRFGGTENAGTGRDFTDYFAYLPSSRAEEAVRLWGEIMAGAAFAPDGFLSEKDVVLEELRLGLNDPYDAVFDEVTSTAYHAHPYANPILGWMSDVVSITRDEAYEHYRTFYVPNNMTLILVGDITESRALEYAMAYFGKMERGADLPEVPTVEPKQTGERRIEVRREALLPMFMVAWHIPEVSHPDFLRLQVLSQILAGGESSRLHRELVYEREIASSVNAWVYGLLDPGLFYVTCMVSPGHTAEETESVLYEVIESVQQEPVEERELEKAVNQYVSSFVFGQESILRQAFVVGYYDALLSWDVVNDLALKVKSITKEEIRDVAGKYFTQENRTVATLVPLKPREPDRMIPRASGGVPGDRRR